ncbi:adenylosuccinate synthase [Chitinimonas sp.]|uniref:adenylosuccinate synthase n=1 Tax=Chitinimonas sp. TaxID=1934313 RepID=UPI002F9420A9
MGNIVVVGAQWGDEGKGRLVDWLSERADIVARYNGGHNAGHTLVVGEQVYKLALLPSGLVRGKFGVIGNGVAVDPEHLLGEIAKLQAQGVTITPDQLMIAETAILVLPVHRALDKAQEARRGTPIGTTLRGIGPAYEDKAGRRALRVCDLADPIALEAKLGALLAHHNVWLQAVGEPTFDTATELAKLLALAPQVLAYTGPAWRRLAQAGERGERILFEGAQAVMLDIDWGTYPYVTSSGTIAANAAAGTGVAPALLGTVLGVSKVYATRVGEGPFPSELHCALGEALRSKGGEFGVNTGRPRRCGWLDLVQLRQSITVAGISALALTKLDVLDGMDEVKLCIGYTLDGERIDHLPASQAVQARLQPVFEVLPGWQGTTRGARTLAELPVEAAALVQRIEALAGIPVAVVTTGPERSDTIVLRDPYQD